MHHISQNVMSLYLTKQSSEYFLTRLLFGYEISLAICQLQIQTTPTFENTHLALF
jgi:hypothetical protein